MASNAKLLLQQLHKKPNVKGDEPGVVITRKTTVVAAVAAVAAIAAVAGVFWRTRAR